MISPEKIDETIYFLLGHGKMETLSSFQLKEETLDKYIRLYLKEHGDQHRHIIDLAMKFGPSEIEAIVEASNKFVPKQYTSHYNFNGNNFKFGAFGDLHLGSKYTDENRVISMFDTFKSENVDFLVCDGDVVEGMSGRDGHIYELKHAGYDAQKKVAIQLLSRWQGKQYYISGNHDLWFASKANMGALIVKDIVEALPDAEYLGEHEGNLFVNKCHIKLWHGEDGGSYATSYRLQKIVEALAEDQIPHILLAGHDHKSIAFRVRDVRCVGLAAIQSQSGWMRRKRLQAHEGFYIISVTADISGKPVRFQAEEFTFR